MGSSIDRLFYEIRSKIREVYTNSSELQKLLENVLRFVEENEDLKSMVKEITLFVDMIKDYMAGVYKDLSKENIYLMIGAMLYIISPIDLLPDFLLLGYIDDILVIWYVMKKLSKEIKAYNIWKNNKNNEENTIYIVEDK